MLLCVVPFNKRPQDGVLNYQGFMAWHLFPPMASPYACSRTPAATSLDLSSTAPPRYSTDRTVTS